MGKATLRSLHERSVGNGGLLFGYDFINLVKNALVPGEVERLVSDFKKM